ncbi:MAG: helix-turn-helix domain-containing protein [Alphaproteobacteria bacterium]|nr:helix-turn-helix domain-containing protein [Alphaproteobacteria bacterium]
MKQELTGEALRSALGRLNWTRERLARAAGLGEATVYRMLAQNGAIQARRSSMEKVAQALEAEGVLDPAGLVHREEPLVTVSLPGDLIRRMPGRFANLSRLWAQSMEATDLDDLLARLGGVTERVSSAYVCESGGLTIGMLGHGLRWASNNMIGRPLMELADKDVAVSASERYWRSIISHEPTLAYCRRGDLDFTVLTVPVLHHDRQAVVSWSELGRPDLWR